MKKDQVYKNLVCVIYMCVCMFVCTNTHKCIWRHKYVLRWPLSIHTLCLDSTHFFYCLFESNTQPYSFNYFASLFSVYYFFFQYSFLPRFQTSKNRKWLSLSSLNIHPLTPPRESGNLPTFFPKNNKNNHIKFHDNLIRSYFCFPSGTSKKYTREHTPCFAF